MIPDIEPPIESQLVKDSHQPINVKAQFNRLVFFQTVILLLNAIVVVKIGAALLKCVPNRIFVVS